MRVHFFDDPVAVPRPPEQVRFNQLGLYVYEDRRRIAVGFDISPFQERPSIAVSVDSQNGDEVSALSVIAADRSSFNLTLHLPHNYPYEKCTVHALLYYTKNDGQRMVVDSVTKSLDLSEAGNK